MFCKRAVVRYVYGDVTPRVFSRPGCHPGFGGPGSIDRPPPSIIDTVAIGHPHITTNVAPFGRGGGGRSRWTFQ